MCKNEQGVNNVTPKNVRFEDVSFVYSPEK